MTWREGLCSPCRMANVLKHEKREQIRALGQLGWSLRRIEEAAGVRRETVSRHLKAAGIVVRPPRQRRLGGDPKAASHPITDPGSASIAASQVNADFEREPVAGWSLMASRREAFRELIEAGCRGRLFRGGMVTVSCRGGGREALCFYSSSATTATAVTLPLGTP